jgi:uncharacterized protein YihD (DUF1040 family)
VAVFSGSLEVVVLRKILRLSNVEWKTEPQLSLRQLSQQTERSVSTYQRIVKDLEDSVTAERYRKNIFDVFNNPLHDDELAHGYFQQDVATSHTARGLFVICGRYYAA